MGKLIAVLALTFVSIVVFALVSHVSIEPNVQDNGNRIGNGDEDDENSLLVKIEGAVAHPGSYQMTPDLFLSDLIESASGLTESADRSCFNLICPIENHKSFYIPEKILTDGVCGVAANAKTNINTATTTELTKINGVGSSRAATIVSYRESNGEFLCIEDITLVDGISTSIFNAIKDTICIL